MWKWLLKRVVNFLIGNNVFGKIQALVEMAAADDNLSGAEKKEKVFAEAKKMAGELSASAINFAIESAVILLKKELKK